MTSHSNLSSTYLCCLSGLWPINSWIGYGNYGWNCISMDETLWGVMMTLFAHGWAINYGCMDSFGGCENQLQLEAWNDNVRYVALLWALLTHFRVLEQTEDRLILLLIVDYVNLSFQLSEWSWDAKKQKEKREKSTMNFGVCLTLLWACCPCHVLRCKKCRRWKLWGSSFSSKL